MSFWSRSIRVFVRLVGEMIARTGTYPRASSRGALLLIVLGLLPSFQSDARAEEPKRYLYVLSKPFESNVELGPFAKTFHFIPISDLATLGVMYAKTGSASAVAALGLWKALNFPSGVFATTLADLKARQWLKVQTDQKHLAAIPSLDKMHFLTGRNVKRQLVFAGIAQKDRSIVLLETSQPLPSKIPDDWEGKQWKKEWGEPIPIQRLEDSRLRIRLASGSGHSQAEWAPSVLELVNGVSLPKDIGERWRAEISASDLLDKQRILARTKGPFKTVKAALKKKLDLSATSALRLEATLLIDNHHEIPVGPIAEGPEARKLLKLDLVTKAIEFIKQDLVGQLGRMPEKKLTVRHVDVLNSRRCLRDALNQIVGRSVVRAPSAVH